MTGTVAKKGTRWYVVLDHGQQPFPGLPDVTVRRHLDGAAR